MSASNKSWLMLAGLALAVAGVMYATKQLNRQPAPRVEITPTRLTSDTDPPPSRTHFPTILRAKPVTEAEAVSSPRYEPRDTPLPVDDPPFEERPAEKSPPPTADFPPDADDSPTTGGQPTTTGSPAFRQPPQIDGQSSLPDVPGTESAGAIAEGAQSAPARPVEAVSGEAVSGDRPSRYVTKAEDSFWNISKQRYGGEGRFFKALYYHNRNRIVRPDQIPAGIAIDTPPLAELKRLYPDLCRPGQRR